MNWNQLTSRFLNQATVRTLDKIPGIFPSRACLCAGSCVAIFLRGVLHYGGESTMQMLEPTTNETPLIFISPCLARAVFSRMSLWRHN